MSRATISQREARRYKAAVRVLTEKHEALLRHWATDYPGIYVGSVVCPDEMHEPSMIQTARRLGRAVIVTVDGQKLKFYAVEP